MLITGPHFGFLEQSCSSILAAGEGTPFPRSATSVPGGDSGAGKERGRETT